MLTGASAPPKGKNVTVQGLCVHLPLVCAAVSSGVSLCPAKQRCWKSSPRQGGKSITIHAYVCGREARDRLQPHMRLVPSTRGACARLPQSGRSRVQVQTVAGKKGKLQAASHLKPPVSNFAFQRRQRHRRLCCGLKGRQPHPPH